MPSASNLSLWGVEVVDLPADYPHYRETFYTLFISDRNCIKLEIANRSWGDANQWFASNMSAPQILLCRLGIGG